MADHRYTVTAALGRGVFGEVFTVTVVDAVVQTGVVGPAPGAALRPKQYALKVVLGVGGGQHGQDCSLLACVSVVLAKDARSTLSVGCTDACPSSSHLETGIFSSRTDGFAMSVRNRWRWGVTVLSCCLSLVPARVPPPHLPLAPAPTPIPAGTQRVICSKSDIGSLRFFYNREHAILSLVAGRRAAGALTRSAPVHTNTSLPSRYPAHVPQAPYCGYVCSNTEECVGVVIAAAGLHRCVKLVDAFLTTGHAFPPSRSPAVPGPGPTGPTSTSDSDYGYDDLSDPPCERKNTDKGSAVEARNARRGSQGFDGSAGSDSMADGHGVCGALVVNLVMEKFGQVRFSHT
jgi:hypothetical protein